MMKTARLENRRMRAGTVKHRYQTFAELWEGLGKVPLHRIRFSPPPGAAREKHVVATWSGVDRRLCELVDGVLIEKAMGTREALLAGLILHYVWNYLEEHDIGIALGADGIVRLWRGLVRIPDVAFFSYVRLPDGELPDEPIASIVPNLAVEVLSESNTRREMVRKLEEYFAAGVQVVWIVDRKKQIVDVFTSPRSSVRLEKNQTLEGGEVLPGFKLPLRSLFATRRK